MGIISELHIAKNKATYYCIRLLKSNMIESSSTLYKQYISEHYEDLDTDNIFDFFYSELLKVVGEIYNNIIVIKKGC